MKAKSWMAGIAAVATLFAAMTAPAGAMAEETTAPGAPQTSANCAAVDNTITVKGEDADAFKIWKGATSPGNRTFKVAKVADYKIYNGTSGGSVHLETVAALKTDIIAAMQQLKSNDGTMLYESENLQGDPMNWLAHQQNELVRKFADDMVVADTALDETQVSINDTKKTMKLTMSEPGLYMIFDATYPKKQIKDTGDTTVEYAGFNNMLVGTPLTDGCKVTNNKGVVDLASDSNAKTGSTTTVRGGFKFTKVGVESDRTGLSGAEFTVYSGENFKQVLKDANGNEVKATSVNGGLVDFGRFKLNAGTYYLKETVVPNGYWSGSAAKLRVTMKNEQGQIKLGSIEEMSSPASGLLTNGENGYAYRNVKSITQLPLTGAMGMAILGVVAVLCIGGASIIIVRARKTKRSFAA